MDRSLIRAMAEKRSLLRLKTRLRVSFHEKGKPERRGFTNNVSGVGLSILSTHVCNPGTELEGELTLPSGKNVVFVGVVRWAKPVVRELRASVPSSMGLRFKTPIPEPALADLGIASTS